MSDGIFFGFTEKHQQLLSCSRDFQHKQRMSLSLAQLMTLKKSEIVELFKKTSMETLHQESWSRCLDVQPVFASGATFEQSEEKIKKGLADQSLYTKAYLAERPMIFFKSFAHEVIPTEGFIGRKPSAKRMIPESEVIVLYNAFAEPVAISVGNDVTAWDLEKENPLYQGYAKYFLGSTSIGPCWRLLENEMAEGFLGLKIIRGSSTAAEYEYSLKEAKRSFRDLGKFLFEDRAFPQGVCLFYGCNRSLPLEVGLQKGDRVELWGSFLPESLVNFVPSTNKESL